MIIFPLGESMQSTGITYNDYVYGMVCSKYLTIGTFQILTDGFLPLTKVPVVRSFDVSLLLAKQVVAQRVQFIVQGVK